MGSVVTCRWVLPGADLEQANRFNRALADRLSADGRVFLSSTLLDGRFALRVAAVQVRTHRREIDLAIQLLREAVDAVAIERATSRQRR